MPNLISTPWIKVLDSSYRSRFLGIEELLSSSHAIRNLEHQSPVTTLTNLRLLLCIVQHALKPTSIEQIQDCFHNGLPLKQLKVYLQKSKKRFELFNQDNPFWQVPFKCEPNHSWLELSLTQNKNNTRVLFDHTLTTSFNTLTFQEATNLLISFQMFGFLSGQSRFGYMKHAHAASAVCTYLEGRNLHETICLNLIPQNTEVYKNDLPVWERESHSEKESKEHPEETLQGVCHAYTPLSYAARLFEHDDSISGEIFLARGVQTLDPGIDPHLTYWKKEDTLLRSKSGFAALWRHVQTLCDPPEDTILPRVLETARKINEPCTLVLVNQFNEKAKFIGERTIKLPLSKDFFTHSATREIVTEAFRYAYGSAKGLEENNANHLDLYWESLTDEFRHLMANPNGTGLSSWKSEVGRVKRWYDQTTKPQQTDERKKKKQKPVYRLS
ncbi:MAG: type I-E CRISPR-associated protein Cse1/CasA [Trueperaceae bacterium]